MNIKKLLLIFLILFSLANKGFAQREANIWYFGGNAGLDFTDGAPVAITNGALQTYEGCATISTSSGALRFYTDGITVWNKQHNAMPNGTGLLGDPSATQSAIIVPKPGSNNMYYVFTVVAIGGSNGLRYSEVNMSLDGGLGDVTVNKNIPLAPRVTERLTAVKKSNNIDIWVIAHDFDSNTFLVYSVTSAGVNITPIISNAGTIDGSYGIGYLKASVDGSKLVQAIDFLNLVDVLNFNNITGIVTDDFTFTSVFSHPYGVEFSQDGTRLYVVSESSPLVYQYNMELGTSAAIIASATIVGTSANGNLCALQTGPDKKIYLAKYGAGTVGCINDPNNLGISCNFVDDAVSLLGKTVWLGLPNFVQSYFNPLSIIYTDTCLGNLTSFSLSDTTNINSVIWNFNDPISGVFNTSSLLNPSHIFTSTGTYTVSAIIHAGSITDTLMVNLTITRTPVFTIGNDAVLCSGTTIVLDPGAGYTSYLWQNLSTNQIYIVSTPGIYYVGITNNCGTTTDTIHFAPPPVVTVNDTSICNGQTAHLTAKGAAIYSWSVGATSTGINTAIATPVITTSYTVTGTTGYCSETAVSTVTVVPIPVVTVSSHTICAGQTANLIASGATTYTWSSGAASREVNTADASPAVTSTYTVVGTASGCSITDSAISTVIVFPKPLAGFTAPLSTSIFNPTVQYTDESTVTAGTITNWHWDFADVLNPTNNTSSQQNPSHTFLDSGTYCAHLIVTSNKGCEDTANYCIVIDPEFTFFIPNAFSPNDDNMNDEFYAKGGFINAFEMQIYDRWGNMIFYANDINKHWNGKVKNNDEAAPEDVYVYVVNLTDIKKKKHKYVGSVAIVK